MILTRTSQAILTYSRRRCEVLVFAFSVAYVAVLIFLIDSTSIYSREVEEQPKPSLFMVEGRFSQLARKQSYGFFDDIPDKSWRLIQERVHDTQPNMMCGHNCTGTLNAWAWYQQNFEPEISCPHERRIGNLGDGGKWVCDPHRLKKAPSCLVYSVGSRGDFSFEKNVLERIGPHCEVHTFDMKNYSHQAAMVNSSNLYFHPWGIAKTDSSDEGNNYKTLKTTVNELGHANKKIDIFKIDCDGCELDTFETWIVDQPALLQQVLVEVHAAKPAPKRFGTTITLKMNSNQQIMNREDVERTTRFFKKMYDFGYVIFHKEPNIEYWCEWPAVEYAFIKLRHDFFKPTDGQRRES
ncbi:hypothetical protein ACA910_004267 [Epithemia clementina (nom. ined.)]